MTFRGPNSLPGEIDPYAVLWFYYYAQQVSWLRSGTLEVLSVGHHVFSSDSRVMVGREGEVWSIKIASVKTSDQGVYQCQVSWRV